MKIPRVLLSTLFFLPALVFAHPGHEANPLHLHTEIPALSGSIGFRIICVGLALCLVCYTLGAAKRR